MIDIQIANALFDDGTFTKLYKAGFISDKVFLYREIYLWVDAQMTSRGISKNKAVLEAEIKFGKGRSTIYEALAKFKKQVTLSE